MNTLIALSIAPVGVGSELKEEVSKVIDVIKKSGLKYRTNSMFTEIEGPYDEVMAVVKEATFVLVDAGMRTSVTLKADIRPGFTDMMDEKVASVREILGDLNV